MIDHDKAAANRKAREERKTIYLRGVMDRYTERFRAAGSEDPEGTAREVHASIDEALARDRGKDAASGFIKCRRGCDHCCHGPVEIWPQEAALLVAAARADGVTVDESLLERQNRYEIDTWRQQPAADRACVFLGEDGACRVYESRPNACRKLLVLTEPALCDADRHPPDRVERWFSWEAEVLESAALEVFGAGLMPRLLIAAMK